MLDEAVAATLEAYPDLADDVRAQLPKAWGTLAARGVMALRERLGRAPSQSERHALWTALWAAVWREQ